ncbi:hypothetical protein GJ496_002674 [Pomphorhynchus laevis]|nr:hypothetical protein GJ496_002674 [Pomphorhynchus laevis]
MHNGQVIISDKSRLMIYNRSLHLLNNIELNEELGYLPKFYMLDSSMTIVCGITCAIYDIGTGFKLGTIATSKVSRTLAVTHTVLDFMNNNHLCSAFSFSNISMSTRSFCCFSLSQGNSWLAIPHLRDGLNSKKACVHTVPTIEAYQNLKVIRRFAFNHGKYMYFVSEEYRNPEFGKLIVSRMCKQDLSMLSSLVEFQLGCDKENDSCYLIDQTLFQNENTLDVEYFAVLIIKENRHKIIDHINEINHHVGNSNRAVCLYSVKKLDMSVKQIQRRCYSDGNVSRGLAHYKPDQICPGVQSDHVDEDICIPPMDYPYPLGSDAAALPEFCVSVPENYVSIRYLNELQMMTFVVKNDNKTFQLAFWNANLSKKMFTIVMMKPCSPVDFLFDTHTSNILLNCNGKIKAIHIPRCDSDKQIHLKMNCLRSGKTESYIPRLHSNNDLLYIPNIRMSAQIIKRSSFIFEVGFIDLPIDGIASIQEVTNVVCRLSSNVKVPLVVQSTFASCLVNKSDIESALFIDVIITRIGYSIIRVPITSFKNYDFILIFDITPFVCNDRYKINFCGQSKPCSYDICNCLTITEKYLKCICNKHDQMKYGNFSLYCNSQFILNVSNKMINYHDNKVVEDFNVKSTGSKVRTYQQIQINSIRPNSGFLSGKTKISLQGYGLDNIKIIFIGKSLCKIIWSASQTLQCQTTKLHKIGKHKIQIYAHDKSVIDSDFIYFAYEDPSVLSISPMVSFENENDQIFVTFSNSYPTTKFWIQLLWSIDATIFTKVLPLKSKNKHKLRTNRSVYYFDSPQINFTEPLIKLNLSIYAEGFVHNVSGGLTYVKPFKHAWFNQCGHDLMCIVFDGYDYKFLSNIRSFLSLKWRCRKCTVIRILKQGSESFIVCRLDDSTLTLCTDNSADILIHRYHNLAIATLLRDNIFIFDVIRLCNLRVHSHCNKLTAMINCDNLDANDASVFIQNALQRSPNRCLWKNSTAKIPSKKLILSFMSINHLLIFHDTVILMEATNTEKIAIFRIFAFLVWYMNSKHLWKSIHHLHGINRLSSCVLTCLFEWKCLLRRKSNQKETWSLSEDCCNPFGVYRACTIMNESCSDQYCVLSINSNNAATNEKLLTKHHMNKKCHAKATRNKKDRVTRILDHSFNWLAKTKLCKYFQNVGNVNRGFTPKFNFNDIKIPNVYVIQSFQCYRYLLNSIPNL